MAEPRRELILQRIKLLLESINSAVIIDSCDVLNGWTVNDPTKGFQPQLDTENKVEGLAAIGIGVKNFKQIAFYTKPLNFSMDGTDKQINNFFYIYDKTKLQTPPQGAVRQILATDLANIYFYDHLSDTLGDVLNDATDGWNFLSKWTDDPEIIVGSPDISDINYIGLSIETYGPTAPAISVNEAHMDFFHFGNPIYFNDIKQVYRQKISGLGQVNIFPIIAFMARDEDSESRTYPAMFNRLTIELVAYDKYGDEEVLDQRLGGLAADIQKALMADQQLNGLAQYVEIKRWEFALMEDIDVASLFCTFEVGYMINQKDATLGA